MFFSPEMMLTEQQWRDMIVSVSPVYKDSLVAFSPLLCQNNSNYSPPETCTDVRRNLLLSRIGPDAFKVLVDHFRPDAVQTKTYVELKRTLQNHFKKDTCVIAERVKFTLCHRKEEETVTQFLISLRAIAGKCAFGQSLDERLRDQLVIGISNDSSTATSKRSNLKRCTA